MDNTGATEFSNKFLKWKPGEFGLLKSEITLSHFVFEHFKISFKIGLLLSTSILYHGRGHICIQTNEWDFEHSYRLHTYTCEFL